MHIRRDPRRVSLCLNCIIILHQTFHHTNRSFTTSQRRNRNGAVPVFHPTPHSTLSNLLETIRQKIFLPAHLKRPQQNLIYRTKYHPMLRSEPFDVEIGPPGKAEKFTLEPIDRTKDVPDGWKSLLEAMRLMGKSSRIVAHDKRAGRKTGGNSTISATRVASDKSFQHHEYDNLIPLLIGLRIAGRKWKSWQLEIISQIAGRDDAIFALIEAIRQAKRTGLYLFDIRVVREIAWACRAHAVRHGWQVDNCGKALRYLQELARLMEDPVQKDEQAKAVNRGEITEKIDPTGQPDVIGVAVELAAMHLSGLLETNADEKTLNAARKTLQTYLERLLLNMESGCNEEEKAIVAGKPLQSIADYELLRWVPVLHGLTVVECLNGDSTHTNARVQIKNLQQKITALRNTLGDDKTGNRRGLVASKLVEIV